MAKILSRIFSQNMNNNHIGMDIREDSILLVYQGSKYFLASYDELQTLLETLKTQNKNYNKKKTVSVCLPEKYLLIKELALPEHLKTNDVEKTVVLHFQQLFPWPIQDCFWDYLVLRKEDANISLEESLIVKIYALNRINYEGVFSVLRDSRIIVQEVQLSTHLIAEKFKSEVVIQLFNKYILSTLLGKNFPNNYIVFEHDGENEKEIYSELIEKILLYLKYITNSDYKSDDTIAIESQYERRLVLSLAWESEFNQTLFENLIKSKKEWLPKTFILIENKDPFSVVKILYERRNLK